MLSLLLALAAPAHAADTEGLTPYLRAQVWATAYDQDVEPQADPSGYGDPEDDLGFKLRRLRFGFQGDYDDFSFEAILGMSAPYDGVVLQDGELQIVDVWGGWSPAEPVTLVAGVTRVPFTRDNMMSSGRMVFQEANIATFHIAPGRDTGALVDFKSSAVRVQAGAFNGNGDILGDSDPGLMYAARAEFMTGGEHVDKAVYRTYGQVQKFTLGVGGAAYFNQELATNTLAYGGDVIVRVDGLAVLLEGSMARITPTDATVDAPGVLVETNRLGFSGQAGYTIGDVWEPAVRFEYFDDQTGETNQGDVQLITAGFTAHLSDDHIQAGGGYILRREASDYAVPNDTVRLWFQFRL
jgi:hypothetical protein